MVKILASDKFLITTDMFNTLMYAQREISDEKLKEQLRDISSMIKDDEFHIDGLMILSLNNISKDVEDEKLKEQLKEVVKKALGNKIEG